MPGSWSYNDGLPPRLHAVSKKKSLAFGEALWRQEEDRQSLVKRRTIGPSVVSTRNE